MSIKRILTITILSLLAIILITGFLFYQKIQDGSSIEVPENTVQNRASKNWEDIEKSAPRNPLKNVYFGDLHVHTNLSLDAFFTGNDSRDVNAAYEFAKGKPMEIVGNTVQLKKPLDFTALTDHSEFLGEMYTYHQKDSENHNAWAIQLFRWRQEQNYEEKNIGNRFRRLVYSPLVKPQHPYFFEGFETTKNNWTKVIDAAEKHYEPGKFTTLAGYEWTFGLIAHIHRNVIFRDMKVPDFPVSSFEAKNEEELWNALQNFENQGSTVMAIPHNSNLSRGSMFTTEMPDGNPITAEYAMKRQKFERLVEVHQHKGNSEVYADFWKNDEFADFENYYEGALTRNSFVRDALKKGLEFEDKLGVNPFKYGLIGSTDSHNSTPGNTVEDSGTPGNFAYSDGSPEVRSTEEWAISGDNPATKTSYAINPGGLVAVWAEANTRGDIYDAMAARETYATSGNRIQLRFFGGHDFENNYETYDSLVTAGYQNGTPMGSDLRLSSTVNRQPSFLIWAAKDPDAANLERIQMIKGWYDGKDLKEEIFDVAFAENWKDAKVNEETGEWDKTKGAAELKTVWTDPNFDPTKRTFYYVRVLEVPTARWTLWDEIKFGVKHPDDAPKTVRERAWSSPIWIEK